MARSSRKRFAVCIDNADYSASLELHKIYYVVPDPDVEAEGEIRVIDESGEDYIYEADRFLELDSTPKTIRALKRSFDRLEEAR